RIRHCDDERMAFEAQRHKVIPEHQIDLNRVKEVVIEVNALQLDELVVIPLSQMAGGFETFLFAFGQFLHFYIEPRILNIGMYRDIRMNAMNTATKIKMTGSTQLSSAVDRTLTSSS